MGILEYIIICLAPAVLFKLAISVMDWWHRYSGSRPGPAPVVDEQALRVRYSNGLRRLAHEHDHLLAGNLPARATRLRAIELAYDDTLRDACRALHLSEPARPLDGATRVQAEADLALHGVTW